MQFSEKHKNWFTNLLLAFVLVSIGFALGKHSVTARPVSDGMAATGNSSPTTSQRLVKIFYMHAAFRCVTCNSIESRARQLVEREFSEAWASKKIIWQEVNFQENEALAKRFDVMASCIVVSVVRGDEIIDFKRLDDVWPLLEKPAEFDIYVKDAVKKALDSISGETG